MNLTEEQGNYWKSFCAQPATPADADQRLYPEVIKIGGTPRDADHGAALIANGTKTATSGLPWEFDETGLPSAGVFSIVVNGNDQPVCIVETISVETKRFDEVDEDFARAYGEWDHTLKSWREECFGFYSRLSSQHNLVFDESSPLVCERFKVVYP